MYSGAARRTRSSSSWLEIQEGADAHVIDWRAVGLLELLAVDIELNLGSGERGARLGGGDRSLHHGADPTGGVALRPLQSRGVAQLYHWFAT